MRVPREYIIAAKYLLIASAIFVVLYFGGKGIIGLVIYGPTKEQTLDVGAHFYGDDVFYTQLEEFGVLEGVSVDGYFNGTGKALVYLEIGNQSFLVLDTTKIATRETTQNQTAPPMVTGYVVAEESEPTGETSQDSDTQEESQPEQEEETPSESEPAVEEEPVSEEEEATQEEGGETQEEGVEESAETPTTTEETSEGEQATEEEEATQEEGGEAAEETTQETTTTIEEESQPSPENETQTETTETTTTVAETGEANETQEQPVTKETTTTVTEESEPIVINETQEQPTTEETTTTVAEAPAEELVGGNVSYENQTLSNVTLPEPENQTKAVVVNETTEEAGVNESMGNLTTQINQTQAVNVSENKTTEETTTTIKGAGEGIAIPRAFSIKFENACNETCQLRINASSLKLRIAIIGEGDLFIDRVRYKFSKITEVVAPELIKEIPDIIIEQNRSFSLILSDYFKGSNLSYSYDSVANIDVKISNGKIFFVPERGFIGSVSTKVYAMNQLGSVESNRFSIRVKSFKGEELLTKLKRVFPSLAFIEITQANKIYTIVYRINDTIVRIRGLENVSSLKNISVGEVNEVVIG